METRELYLTRNGEIEIPTRAALIISLKYHQYLINHMLRTLEEPFYSQETKDHLMKHTLKHLRRMGESFERFLEADRK